MRTATLLLFPLLLLGSGCTSSSPAPRPSEHPPLHPKWILTPQDVVLHDVEQATSMEILSIKFTSPMPVPLGETFVNDLVLAVRNPTAPNTYKVSEHSRDLVVATLARAPEVANQRTGFMQAFDGKVQLTERGDRAFAGSAWLRFRDPQHDGAIYTVVARFASRHR